MGKDLIIGEMGLLDYQQKPGTPTTATFRFGFGETPAAPDYEGVATGSDHGSLGPALCHGTFKFKVNTDLAAIAGLTDPNKRYELVFREKPWQ